MAMEFHQDLVIILAISSLGLITVLKSLIKLFNWVYITFLRPQKNLKQYGSWALITGPTDGIGKALALDLASEGLNLVLVGRNPSKLDDTKREINERLKPGATSVELKSIVVDLAQCGGSEMCDMIEKETEGLDIGVVVNNAGLAYPYPRFFHQVHSDLVMDIIKVNIEAVTWITKAMIPRMLKKNKGAIVIIGSASDTLCPTFPLYTIYAATKAYLTMFTRSIGVEYKKSGIDIQLQVPVLVATKMSNIRKSSVVVASPETYSKSSMRSIGYEFLSVPYWSHSIQWLFIKALPDFLVNRLLYHHFVAVNKRTKLKESMRKNKNN